MRNWKTKLALLLAIVAVVSAIGGGVHWKSVAVGDGTDTEAVHWSK